MKKFLLLVLSAVLFALCLTACGDSSLTQDERREMIIGTWNEEKPEKEPFFDETTAFMPDGKIVSPNDSITGTYKIYGNMLVATIYDRKEREYEIKELTDKKLVLVYNFKDVNGEKKTTTHTFSKESDTIPRITAYKVSR